MSGTKFHAFNVELGSHQILAVNRLESGKILHAGVGTGKSRTALAYYYCKECGGSLPGIPEENELYSDTNSVIPLYIITTAKKRDSRDWESEAIPFGIGDNYICVDSWNNIEKYRDVHDCFFVFDEQRAVGSGKWAKTFVHIAKRNRWIMLTATPGDTWIDYIPVFIANGFYKNKTEFMRKHVVLSPYTTYPQVTGYLDVGVLVAHRDEILVDMEYIKPLQEIDVYVRCDYDKAKYRNAQKDRWDMFNDQLIESVSGLCYVLRKICSTDESRILAFKNLVKQIPKVIVFYNFDYELDILRASCKDLGVPFAELNGHKHDQLPTGSNWVYLVQYAAGAEAWNCITTNSIIFYSDTYSYKIMQQSRGRISRMNTKYSELMYYHLVSNSGIEAAIQKALKNKRNFNESRYFSDFS